jgi:hypothetical protein
MTDCFDKCWIRTFLIVFVVVGLACQSVFAAAPPQGQDEALANDPVERAIR